MALKESNDPIEDQKELEYNGKLYILIVVTELKSFSLESAEDEVQTYILDYRNVKMQDVLTNLQAFCEFLLKNSVSFIWLNCQKAKFLELRERLKRHLVDRVEDYMSYIVKMTIQTLNTLANDALRTSVNVISFASNLKDISHLVEAHPGLLRDGKVRLLPDTAKRKHEQGTAIVSQAYRDKRRPGKGVFKLMKKMQKEQPMEKNRPCYMCNSKGLFDQFCEECLTLNDNMKTLSCDMTGRYAIVTGGRIKIGYETSLRLLRNGCYVIVTTRFTVDAVKRFSNLEDFDTWKHRLKIFRLDLLDMKTIEEFLAYVNQTIPHLDILINNAAQTIHRPSQFYESLINGETNDIPKLSNDGRNLLAGSNAVSQNAGSLQASLPWVSNAKDEFPKDRKDEHGEQIDMRARNSWTYNLDEVPLQELLQVLTINAVGPFILTARLKRLLLKSPFERKFVVNVSAMEGQFSRFSKGHRHPHTNMAKAALNMMTRTSGLEYQMDKIYMTAVDTGWVTDERPFSQAQHEAEVKGFIPPLDCHDGAARVCHPIIHGINPNNEPYFAVFLKNYKPKNW